MANDANDTLRTKGSTGVVRSIRSARVVERSRLRQEHELEEKFNNLLVRGSSGVLSKTAGNVGLVLLHHPQWRGTRGFDELQQAQVWRRPPPVVSGFSQIPLGPVEDSHTALVGHWLELNYGLNASSEVVERGIALAAKEGSFHSIQEWLDTLEWDHVGRLDSLLIDCAGAEDSEYVRAVTSQMFIGGVARVRKPGSKLDTMVVLEGAQGIGKSSFLQALVSAEWFDDHLPNVRDKEAPRHLVGRWLVEVAELESIKGAESSLVKSFLSRGMDRWRPPYAVREITVPRSCFFVGTTNSEQYLIDSTGGRRFLPVRLTQKIDLDYVARNRSQLWAEADYGFKNGESCHLDPELVLAAAVEQDERFISDPREEELEEFLRSRDQVTIRQCYVALQMDELGLKRWDGKRMAEILRRCGFAKRRGSEEGGQRKWVYQRIVPRNALPLDAGAEVPTATNSRGEGA
ncbi:MAG: hypothetical protein JW395_0695 [Nitrospira sp.]|nr:hypothetical protein [Nitrospira sp.]